MGLYSKTKPAMPTCNNMDELLKHNTEKKKPHKECKHMISLTEGPKTNLW